MAVQRRARRVRRDRVRDAGPVWQKTQDVTARLSAEGKLFTCLFALRGHDLRAEIRSGATDEELAQSVRTVWGGRTDRYSDLRSEQTAGLQKVEMSYIGG